MRFGSRPAWDSPDRKPPDENNDGRRGRPFSVRLTDDERERLEQLAKDARDHMPGGWERKRQWQSLGGFVVWAALQWAPPAPERPRGTTKRARQ